MNAPQRPFPRPPEPGPDLVTIMLRMERAVRQYRRYTLLNVFVFGINAALLSALFTVRLIMGWS